ncbi:hypothetical protein [Tateyamaria sp.]|uniref:hypothetical protein n=1 Tax=Tateyamaria sp. TaxID=1929288 RepID=UPI00329DDFB9
MTAILDGMHRLDAAHKRGEINAIDLAAAKARLLDSVPDADAPETAVFDEPPPREKRTGIGPTLLLCTLVMTICVGAAMLLTGDIMLSTTLAITVLAAMTVVLFRQLDG